MIYGNIDRYGDVTISFNPQNEKLMIPNCDKQLLPCDMCGAICMCDENTVSIVCMDCYAVLDEYRNLDEGIRERYRELRQERPDVKPPTIIAYLTQNEEGVSFKEFACPGHEWTYTGTAYGGDDESYMGEGRCYCVHCGADGDA